MSTPHSRSDAPEGVTVPESAADAGAVLEAAFPPGASAPAPASEDALVRMVMEALGEYRDAGRGRTRLERALKNHLSPQALPLYRALVDAIDNERSAAVDLHVADLARHFPGFAPAIRLTWAHVIDCRMENVGRCCAAGTVEP